MKTIDEQRTEVIRQRFEYTRAYRRQLIATGRLRPAGTFDLVVLKEDRRPEDPPMRRSVRHLHQDRFIAAFGLQVFPMEAPCEN